jgi:uncharacterized protein YjbI with pentapeptide repeats
MREITAGELGKILKEHKRWCGTDEDEGERANLSQANLSNADMSNANLREVDLSSADLSDADLSNVNLSGADLSSANLYNANLGRADLREADLSSADLSDADLSNVNLSGADLSSADLRGADLYSADLRNANLSGADLSGTNLSSADLSGTDLSGVNLSGVDLFRTNLSDANLYNANLSEANLSGAVLHCADLRGAKLYGADLREADLSSADLSGADLSGANLSEANMSCTNLIRVRGLTMEQLSSVETLCDAELSSERIKQVRKKYPHLLGEIELDEEKLSKRKIVTLRSSYKTVSASEVKSMPNVYIRKKHSWGFTVHSKINNDYNLKARRGDKVVVDNATGLMWHQSGSDDQVKWGEAKYWVEDLNSEGYAGYQDWRLPTLEEVVSLIESSRKNRWLPTLEELLESSGKGTDLYMNHVFSKQQKWSWTGDKDEYEGGSENVWGVLCDFGFVVSSDPIYERLNVRPVRSMR